MAWWGWLLLFAYLPVAALQAVWLGHAIDGMERREARRSRKHPSSGRRLRSRERGAGGGVEAGSRAEPPGKVPG